MRRYFLSLCFLTGLAWGDQCQITSPLPVPVTINGCTFSSSLPSNSTSYIQNTLGPTTTTQMFSVENGSMTTNATLGYLSGTQCLHEINGSILGTGADCGSGGSGGSSSLQVTQGGVQITSPTSSMNFQTNQFSLSAVGSTSTVALNLSSITAQGQNVIDLTSSLQAGSTFYTSSGTVAGPLYVSSLSINNNSFISPTGVPAQLTINRSSGTSGLYAYNNTGNITNEMFGLNDEIYNVTGAIPPGLLMGGERIHLDPTNTSTGTLYGLVEGIHAQNGIGTYVLQNGANSMGIQMVDQGQVGLQMNNGLSPITITTVSAQGGNCQYTSSQTGYTFNGSTVQISGLTGCTECNGQFVLNGYAGSNVFTSTAPISHTCTSGGTEFNIQPNPAIVINQVGTGDIMDFAQNNSTMTGNFIFMNSNQGNGNFLGNFLLIENNFGTTLDAIDHSGNLTVNGNGFFETISANPGLFLGSNDAQAIYTLGGNLLIDPGWANGAQNGTGNTEIVHNNLLLDAGNISTPFGISAATGTFTGSVTAGSMSVVGAGGETVTYGLNVGSMTGAGLSTCGDSTHALAWSSSNNLFSCQNIVGSGGGGSSSLAVTTGSSSGFTPPAVSSPTGVVLLNQSQFTTALQGSATAFITISYSTNSQSGSYTAVSTDSVVEANCASACTITLPTAVGISGKVYFIKILGVGTATIATTSSQKIDGSSTVTPNPNQYAEIEVISNGSNWEIL